jgi:hypothetical protein
LQHAIIDLIAQGRGLAGDPERVAGAPDAVSRRLKQFDGHLARIDAASCPSVPAHGLGKSDGVGGLLGEDGKQQIDDEFQRRGVVIVKDNMEPISFGVNIVHGQYSPG